MKEMQGIFSAPKYWFSYTNVLDNPMLKDYNFVTFHKRTMIAIFYKTIKIKVTKNFKLQKMLVGYPFRFKIYV